MEKLQSVIQTDDENLCELQCVGTKAVSKTCVLGPFSSLSLVGMGKLGIRRPWERVGFGNSFRNALSQSCRCSPPIHKTNAG